MSSSNHLPTSQLDQLAIKLLLYANMHGSTQWINEAWHYPVEDDHDPSGRKVWGRIPLLPSLTSSVDDPEFIYVNVVPGELSTTRPTDSQDVVYDVPRKSSLITPIEHLEMFIQTVDREKIENDSEYEHLLKCAENALAASRVETKHNTLRSFWTEAQQLGFDETLSAEQIQKPLYKNYFENFRLDGYTFSPAMLMVNLELHSGHWVPDLEYKDSIEALSTYMHWAPHEYPEIPDIAVQLGNSHFEEGKRRRNQARSALTLDNFYSNLYFATHHFFTALLSLHSTTKWVDSSKFSYDLRMADEDYAVSVTGLCANLEDFIDGKRFKLERMLARLLRQDRELDARKLIRELTGPRNPIYPKYFAQVSLAIAMVTVGGKWLNQGIESLRSLENEFKKRATLTEMSSTELDRVLYKLAIGYKESGDIKQAESYTAQLYGRQLMRRVLYGEGVTPEYLLPDVFI